MRGSFFSSHPTETSLKKIYITQLIYILDGKENTFNEFENVAIPFI